jgi:hypothetical protein
MAQRTFSIYLTQMTASAPGIADVANAAARHDDENRARPICALWPGTPLSGSDVRTALPSALQAGRNRRSAHGSMPMQRAVIE